VLLSQSASPSVVCLSSPRTIYLGFFTEGKLAAILITPFSWGSQRARYFPYQLHASNKFSGAVAGEHRRIISLVNWAPSNSSNKFFGAVAGEEVEDFCEGSSRTHILYFVIVLLYFIYFTCIVYIKNPKKLESLVVVFTCFL
jgi:hypothetical protein